MTGVVVEVLEVVEGVVVVLVVDELDAEVGAVVDDDSGTDVVDGMVVVALTMAVAKFAICPAIHVALVR